MPAPQSTPPTTNGPVTRGDETRQLLLEAGLALFSERGFESVSTRELAGEAKVNIAAIAYHFGGKRDLYRAVLQQLVADTDPYFIPALESLGAGIGDAGTDKAKLAALARDFFTRLLSLFLDGDFMQRRAAMVMREYANPSEDFSILYDGRIEPLHKVVSELTGAALDLPAEDDATIIRAHAVLGEIFVFAIARVALWKRLGWTGYPKDKIADISRLVSASILSSLNLPGENA